MSADQIKKMITNRTPMNEIIRKKISETKKGKPWTEARRIAQLNKKKDIV